MRPDAVPIPRRGPALGRVIVLSLLLALAGSPARADSLDALREVLKTLRGTSPLKATATATLSGAGRGDTGKSRTEAGSAAVTVDAGAHGLRLAYAPDLLARLSAEGAAETRDPNAPTPIRKALDKLKPEALVDLAHAAAALLRELEGARLTGERSESWQGVPARVLSVQIPTEKFLALKGVKKASVTFDIWIDANGRPLASKTRAVVSGRVAMVVSFDATFVEDTVYAVLGDRLVVRRRELVESVSGLAAGGDSRTTLSLQPED